MHAGLPGSPASSALMQACLLTSDGMRRAVKFVNNAPTRTKAQFTAKGNHVYAAIDGHSPPTARATGYTSSEAAAQSRTCVLTSCRHSSQSSGLIYPIGLNHELPCSHMPHTCTLQQSMWADPRRVAAPPPPLGDSWLDEAIGLGLRHPSVGARTPRHGREPSVSLSDMAFACA